MRKGKKDRMMSLLFELLKDSKRSDRELAKVLGVSQPTVTRMRSRLVKKGMIREFTVVPDFVKMGYTIMAICLIRSKKSEDITEKTKEWAKTKPNVIFVARAQGMGKNAVHISLHKNYASFSNFIHEVRVRSEDTIEDFDTVLISLEENVIKPLSQTYLGEREET